VSATRLLRKGRAVALLIALAGGVVAPPAYASKPKTVFQCIKQNRHRSAASRAQCIARVKAEKPGTSCAHPLRTETNGFEQKGDKRDLTVEVIGKNLDALDGTPWQVQVRVNVLNPHIVICPRVELKVWVERPITEDGRTRPGPGKQYTYFLVVTPELGEAAYTSRALTVPLGSYAAVASARRRS
jgi:hypothetical protein